MKTYDEIYNDSDHGFNKYGMEGVALYYQNNNVVVEIR